MLKGDAATGTGSGGRAEDARVPGDRPEIVAATAATRPGPGHFDPRFRPKLLTTLKGYDRATFAHDAAAGFTVAMVALPLAMAIAIASGAEPGAGILTAIVAGFLISALGGSRVQIGGPTGAFIVVVYGVIATFGHDGLLLATLMAGVILVVAGLAGAGALIRHVPEPVVNGFTIGIAIVIATSQIADFAGMKVAHLPADFIPKIAALAAARTSIDPASLAVAVVTLVLIVLFRRIAPRLPGLIVAVGATSLAVRLLGLDVDTIGSRFGGLTGVVPSFALPAISAEGLVRLLPSAMTIAFLAGIESLLSAMVADRMAGTAHRSSTELVAQGVANCASALVGGLPATGAIARTATNIRAGGRTPVAGIVHALVLALAAAFAAPLAAGLALPALAAVLMVTAWNMAEPQHLKERLSGSAGDILLLVLTGLLTVVVDLTVAIATGVTLGLALRLLRARTPPPDWHVPDR